MQKKLKSLFIVASLGLATSLAIVACGEGAPDILNDFLQDLGLSEDVMKDQVDDVMEHDPPPSSVAPQSSAGNPPGSSAAPNPNSSASNPTSSAAPGGSSAGGNSSTTTPSSSSVQKSSAAAVAGNCQESKPISTFTCGWDGSSGTPTPILTPGKILKPAAATPPSGCSISWSYAPNTTDIALLYDCEKLPSDGVSALGSKNYVLFAELTCDDGKHVNACNPKEGWSSKKAPELTGKCVWDKNPPEVTSARGAKPSGVTSIDTDNICGSTRSVVYKYDNGTKDWPATGILPEWKDWGKDKTETYIVEAVLNCPAYSAVVSSPCDPLKVSGGVEHVIECTCVGSDQCQVNDKICKADGKTGNTVTLTTSECVEVTVYNYNNPHYKPEVGLRCSSPNNSSFVVSVNGKSVSVAGNGLVPMGKLEVEDETSLGTLCLTSGAASISCQGPGQ